jgi:sarcosine oxidase
MSFDVAVVGLGVMGAATAYELALRGARVVAFDQYAPPHALGSSHGRTRIIREAYFEHPSYVPLVRRARERWLRLERDAHTRLLVRTGGVMVGDEGGTLVTGALASAVAHDVAHERLDAASLHARFPAFHAEPGMVALFEHNAGVLLAERCVGALLEGALAHRAELRTETPVLGWDAGDGGVTIRTAADRVRAGSLVLAAGAWLPDLLGEASPPLAVERQLFHWYAAGREPDRYTANALPLALWEYDAGRIVATFPDIGHGVKIGTHHDGETTTADTLDRTPRPEEERAARALLERFLPGGDWQLLEAGVCMYTNTPDHQFIIDTHADTQRVIVLSACSGHGFKFAPAIAEIVADLALEGGTMHEWAPFRATRFARPAG